MKLKPLLLLIMLLPAGAYCQSVKMPAIGYAEDPTTRIIKIDITKTNTVVTFKHTLQNKGAWVELNKSIYLQDANGEERYNYVRSEGVPLRPKKLYADKPNQEVIFKVYFRKLKPGTKAINVIERARSIQEQMGTNHYFNYFNVSLIKSGPVEEHVKVTDVVLAPPPPQVMEEVVTKTDTTNVNSFKMDSPSAMMNNFAPMMGNMYTSMLDAQIKMYSNPETTTKLAQIAKSYYDALIKAGFTTDAALKIVISKPLVSMDGKQ